MKTPLTYHPKSPGTNIGGYRYFFNGQEGDNEVFGETSNFGYEFRQYDSRLGKWWSVDPKWNEYPSVSPFVFCNGSPIMMADVKGKEAWKPAVDKNGNILAIQEDGDNYDSFKSFMGPAYGENDLLQMYGQLQEGQINLTQSYGHQFEIMTTAINEAKNNPNFEKEENYNCWGASLALSRGDRLYGNGPDKWLPWSLDGVGVNSPFLFDIALNSSYKPVSKENASVGLTVMRFGMIGLGNNKHGSIYMGRDNAGNEYTFTKNGWNARPIICMTKQIQGYGYVNGENWNESGYYVHEKIGGQQ